MKTSFVSACALAALSALTFASPAAATTATFNFDSDVIGTSTIFANTNNGVTATFSSPADPGGFAVSLSFFQSLTGNVLLNPGPAATNQIPLTISFSQPVTSISLLFAVNTSNAGLDGLSLLTNAGGSVSAFGSVPGGFFFPEGSLSFSGAAFTSVVLSSAGLDFAIDNVVVSDAAATPLPAALPLFATGLAGLGWFARRRRKQTLA
jgi:hypothetical protein